MNERVSTEGQLAGAQSGAMAGGAAAGGDPSMEDILASIRRILNEDEGAGRNEAAAAPAGGDVLVLDPSMLVPEETPPPVPPAAPAAEEPATLIDPAPSPSAASPRADASHEPMTDSLTDTALHDAAPTAPETHPAETLVAPQTAAAALGAMSSLVRQLAAERSTRVYAGGPTLEDMVRDELRPLLKSWLDTHLPPLVERVVRAEIERLMVRASP